MKKNNDIEEVSNNTQKENGFRNTIIILLFIGLIFAISFRDTNSYSKDNSQSKSNQTTTEKVEDNTENTSTTTTTKNKRTTTKKTPTTTKQVTEKTTTKVTESVQTQTTTQSTPEVIAASIEYSCPIGYTLSGTQCVKETMNVAERRYYCSSGTLEGSFCIEEVRDSVYVSSSAKASCSNYANTGMYEKCACEKSGGDWSISGCYTTKTRRRVAESEYYCDYNETLSGSLCISKDYVSSTIQYVCPAGYTKSGMSCYKY